MTEHTPEQQDLIERQAARWADPALKTGAEARMDKVNEAQKRNMWRTTLQHQQVDKAPSFKHKLYWLRQMTDTFAEAVAPQAACKAGCSHCCYQPVMITEAEAQCIAKETGAVMEQPAKWLNEPASQYTGQPCPFLADGRCSIYAHRPIACRLLYNMDVDSLQCQIVPGAPAKVPYANAMNYNMLYVHAHVGRKPSFEALSSVKMADLRDFFPHGRQMTLELPA